MAPDLFWELVMDFRCRLISKLTINQASINELPIFPDFISDRLGFERC